mmetsp:Transcript_12047/g.30358  ORF Transcript_12047/g.30358 Transcript_12047/m.30358 type:complete len:85 (+) Transcript_12047:164-418(+)|eukprot:5296714-Prymnesium_polylepis.2
MLNLDPRTCTTQGAHNMVADAHIGMSTTESAGCFRCRWRIYGAHGARRPRQGLEKLLGHGAEANGANILSLVAGAETLCPGELR